MNTPRERLRDPILLERSAEHASSLLFGALQRARTGRDAIARRVQVCSTLPRLLPSCACSSTLQAQQQICRFADLHPVFVSARHFHRVASELSCGMDRARLAKLTSRG